MRKRDDMDQKRRQLIVDAQRKKFQKRELQKLQDKRDEKRRLERKARRA